MQESVPSFNHMGPRDLAKIARVDGKHLYPLRHLTRPFFLYCSGNNGKNKSLYIVNIDAFFSPQIFSIPSELNVQIKNPQLRKVDCKIYPAKNYYYP